MVVDPGWGVVHSGPVGAQVIVCVGPDGDHVTKDKCRIATTQSHCTNIIPALAVRAWQHVSVPDGASSDRGMHESNAQSAYLEVFWTDADGIKVYVMNRPRRLASYANLHLQDEAHPIAAGTWRGSWCVASLRGPSCGC